jgi:hypothetical protein
MRGTCFAGGANEATVADDVDLLMQAVLHVEALKAALKEERANLERNYNLRIEKASAEVRDLADKVRGKQ